MSKEQLRTPEEENEIIHSLGIRNPLHQKVFTILGIENDIEAVQKCSKFISEMIDNPVHADVRELILAEADKPERDFSVVAQLIIQKMREQESQETQVIEEEKEEYCPQCELGGLGCPRHQRRG